MNLGRLTRRELAALSAGALTALAQTPSAPPGNAKDWNRIALDAHHENSEALARFQIPVSLEPAFQFKA